MTAEPTYVPLQPWVCEKCGKRGDVEMPEHLNFWGGYERILVAHRTASPECHQRWGLQFVRAPTIALPKG